jgi:hypothetical protein
VVGDLSQRDSRRPRRDVVQELALVLGEVRVVAAAQVQPHLREGALEPFIDRTVHELK